MNAPFIFHKCVLMIFHPDPSGCEIGQLPEINPTAIINKESETIFEKYRTTNLKK